MSPNLQSSPSSEPMADRVAMTVEEITETLALTQIQPEPEEPFVTVVTDTLPYQLDSIAWNHTYSIFAFGTYDISPNDSTTRIGQLYLAQLCDTSTRGYTVLQTVLNLPGILDIKWNADETSIVAATSEGLLVFRLDHHQGFGLVEVATLKTVPDMALYVTWLNSTDLLYSDSAGNVVTWSRTDGNAHVQDSLTQLNDRIGITTAPLHQYFVWFVHFDPIANLVYSGDDAGYFRAFRLQDLANPEVHAKRQFPTGVTSILTKGDIVAVGCYDDHLRLFTRTVAENGRITMSKSPLLDFDLGGTVWRTMWLPPLSPLSGPTQGPELEIAVAAGRNGIHVITVNPQADGDWSCETTFCCFEHKGSLAYGLDIHANSDSRTYTVATVYFDSKVLHVFTLKP